MPRRFRSPKTAVLTLLALGVLAGAIIGLRASSGSAEVVYSFDSRTGTPRPFTLGARRYLVSADLSGCVGLQEYLVPVGHSAPDSSSRPLWTTSSDPEHVDSPFVFTSTMRFSLQPLDAPAHCSIRVQIVDQGPAF